jgi:serine/threonine-protein kinase RsbW
MTPTEERALPARMGSLPLALGFVEAFCEQHGIARDDGLRLTLIVEELFTNTVMHGHGGDSDAPVRVALQCTAAHVTLCFEDTAPLFDLRQRLDAAASDAQAGRDENKAGGKGIELIARLSHRIDHAFVDGNNRLQLVVLRKG